MAKTKWGMLITASYFALLLSSSTIVGSNSAWAACVNHDRCVVNDGSPINIDHKYFKTDKTGARHAAVFVDKNSTVIGNELEIFTPAGNRWDDYYAGFVGEGSKLVLEHSKITGHIGVNIAGKAAQLEMLGGIITASGNALFLEGGGTAELEDVVISMTGNNEAVILDKGDYLGRFDGNNFTMRGGRIESLNGGGIRYGNSGRGKGNSVRLEDVTLNVGGRYAISGREGADSVFTMLGGTIVYHGDKTAVEMGRGDNLINGTKIISDGKGISVFSNDRRKISHLDLSNFDLEITDKTTGSVGLEVDVAASVTVSNGRITTRSDKGHGIHRLASSGSLNAKALPFSLAQVDVLTFGVGAHGFYHYDGETVIEDSSFTTSGQNSFAVHFSDPTYRTGGSPSGMVDVDNSTLLAHNSVAVVLDGGEHTLNVSNKSMVKGDALVVAGPLKTIGAPGFGRVFEAHLTFNADNSQLFGAAFVSDDKGAYPFLTSQLAMKLENNSVWTINPSLTAKHWAQDPTVEFGTNSEASFLALDRSEIIFDPQTTGLYQTLTIGSGFLDGRSDVYKAANQPKITFNAGGRDKAGLYTDRLLINGDVLGKTSVMIKSGTNSSTATIEDMSIIQVSGHAEADSFMLDRDYVTLHGKPYTYGLYAYGPTSSQGLADESQRWVQGTTPYWDWRLQNKGLRTGATASVAPQVANYLLMPPSLFHVGRNTIDSLHYQLDGMRQAENGFEANLLTDQDKGRGRGHLFMRGFGGDYHYASGRDASHYGYDGEIHHASMQVGGSLNGFETAQAQMQFGFAGSYGEMSLDPRSVANSGKSEMNLWLLSPYLTWAHQSGLYVDVTAHYGKFDGGTATDFYAHTAKLQGVIYAASLEAGRPFPLMDNKLIFMPQVRLLYQRLKFDETYDIDGFPIVIGAPEQWTVSLGGRLERHFIHKGEGHTKLIGKLNLLHSFGREHSLWLGDAFKSGQLGTQIEAGLGLDIAVDSKLNLYGDVNWQQRLSKTGSSGISLNGGFRVNF